jgi:hypothetical protein
MNMRSLKNLFYVSLLLISFSANAFSGDPSPSVSMKMTHTKRFSLYVKTLFTDTVVTIKNIEGTLIFTENLKKGYVYRKTFDISDLPETTYLVSVKDAESIKVYSVTKDEITVIENEVKVSETVKK